MWKRLKLIFDKEAQLPTIQDRNEVLRVFYSFRIGVEANINYFEINKKDFTVVYQNKYPVLCPASRGLFDDCGVMPSCIVGDNLYYTGWSVKGKTPYIQTIGMAVFNESKNIFERTSDGPILGVGGNVPYLANSAFVIGDDMWFCNGTGWIENAPTYNICHAIRNEYWQYDQNFTPIGKPEEINSRPFVKNGNFYYAKKTIGQNYSIYMNDKQILNRSEFGWDSEMVCYPFLFDNYMFYNGNGYGKTGIGVAECVI